MAVIAQLEAAEKREKMFGPEWIAKCTAKCPSMILEPALSLTPRYLSRSNLVDDAKAEERERLKMTVWTPHERKVCCADGALERAPRARPRTRTCIHPTRACAHGGTQVFADKFVTYPKNFRRIKSFLEHKTVGECISFYYRCEHEPSSTRSRPAPSPSPSPWPSPSPSPHP